MTLKTKLSIAFAVSIVLMGALCWVLLRGRAGKMPGEEDSSRAARTTAAAGPAEPQAKDAATKAPEAVRVAARAPAGGPEVVFSADEVWTLVGRIVKPDESGALWPVEGATVRLTPHPRRTKPEEAPPPQKKVTGPDGLFELAGCPGRLSMRIEIDEPSSAFRVFSFQLGDPDSTGRRDLGDIPLEAALTLKLELVGPKGEPVEKGYILVGRETSVQGLALSNLRINDSRREARELGGGKYVLERTGAGLHSMKVQAPGCAGTKESTEMPREEAFVIHLQEGRRLAGTVVTSDGKPVAGAEVQVDSGPNLNEPDPKMASDAEGHFAFDILSDGNYDVSARAEGYTTEKKRGVPSGTEDIELMLAPESVLSGKVVTSDDGSPVSKAKVTVYTIKGESFSADSDSSGVFTLKKLPAGAYSVAASHREYAAAAIERQELQEGQRVEGVVIRLPAGLVATGKVIDSETKEPVADAQVFFDLTRQGSEDVQGPGVRKTGKAGPDGAFEVKGLGEGVYQISARATGFLSGKRRKLDIAPGSEKNLTVTLDLGSSVEGRVVDAAGKPIAGATVRPSINFTSPEEWNGPLAGIWNLSTLTDAAGKFRLDGLGAHKAYTLKATHADYATGEAKGIAIGAREAVDGVEITLPRGGTIRGRVLDAKGEGIAGAKVQASEEKEREEDRNRFYGVVNSGPKTATTDSDGAYTFAALGAGKYTVSAQAKARMSAQKKGVEVAEGKPTDGVDIVLGAGETFAGRVTDVDGNPIAGADVDISAEGSAQTQTDADGRFQLIGLARGNATVGIRKQGFDTLRTNVTVPGSEGAFKLERLAKIVGNLRAKGQEVFRNFDVMAMKKRADQGPAMDGGGWTNSSRNDPSGRFEVDVGAGTYVLEARVNGFAPSRSDAVTVKAGDRVEGIFIDLSRGGIIQGVVAAKGTGEPVEGANIYVEIAGNAEKRSPFGLPGSRSDADGSFTIEGIPEGVAVVHASHDQHAQGSVSGVNVREGQPAIVRLELGLGGGIRGLVTKAGAPVAGAFVYASKTDGGGNGKQATTDADGRFEMGGLAEGEYSLSVSGSGRRGGGFNTAQKVVVYEGQITDTEVAQAAGLRVFGRVTSGGEPLRSGRIEAISPQRGWGGGNSQIESNGDYSLEVPGPGVYMFMIRLSGQGGEGGAKFDLTVPPGSTELHQDIELPSGEIAGVVLDAVTGEPIANAQVIAFPSGTSSRNFSSMLQDMKGMSPTNGVGRFAVTALPPGIYALHVFSEGYADGFVNGIKIDERRSSRDNRIALERGISFRARVVDPEGRPVSGAMLFLRGEDGALVQLSRPHMTGADGSVDLAGIRPAVYEVSVIHQSYAIGRATVDAQEGSEALLRVQPGGRVVVQVVNRQGRPIEGASVELLDESGQNVLEDLTLAAMMRGPGGGIATAADGTLVVEQVLPGKYKVAARSGDARSREEKLTVEQGKGADARLTVAE